MFRLAAVLIDLDCADANGRAGRFAPALLRVELAVYKYNARANDFPIDAHLSVPLSNSSQSPWSREVTILSLNAMLISS